ncbi:MAG: hypothetical protein AB7R89_10005 [Dehalococcoidia bacterium]
MRRTITVIFDGEVLRPQEPVELERDIPYSVTIHELGNNDQSTQEPGMLDGILALAQDLGVEDLSEQLDHYLYGTPKR